MEQRLLTAAGRGDSSTVNKILRKCPTISLNVRDEWNDTALDKACKGGHYAVTKLLVNVGVNVNETSGRQGVSPLHSAVQSGDIDLVKLLVLAGADPAALGPSRLRPVDAAPYGSGAWLVLRRQQAGLPPILREPVDLPAVPAWALLPREQKKTTTKKKTKGKAGKKGGKKKKKK